MKFLRLLIPILVLTGCQLDPGGQLGKTSDNQQSQNPAKPTPTPTTSPTPDPQEDSNKAKEDRIAHWYANNSQNYQFTSTVAETPFAVQLALPIDQKTIDNVDSDRYPTTTDKIAYLALNKEGYNSTTDKFPLIGMMIPNTFVHENVDRLYRFENVVLQNPADLTNLLNQYNDSTVARNTSLASLFAQWPFEKNNIIFVSGVEIRDSKSRVSSYTKDEQLAEAWEQDPTTFVRDHGDSWIKEVVFGYYNYQAHYLTIHSLGSHSREEAILALRFSWGIGRPLTEDEEFWYKWVLGRYDAVSFGRTFPTLFSQFPVSTSVWNETKMSAGTGPLDLTEVDAKIASGNCDGLSSSEVEFTFEKY